MPRVWRVMTVDGDKPKVGPTARTLGVRVPPSRYCDVLVEADGTVGPGSGGMSVAPAWRDLPRHRIPARLQNELPSAAGSNKDACWRMGDGAFDAGPIANGLQLRPDSPKHGVVEPSATEPAATYQADLAATRDRWVIDEEQKQTMATSDQNPRYAEYVRLLTQLHGLVRDGKGDSEEADALRDRMDEPWLHLSEEEISSLDQLLADKGAPNAEDSATPRPCISLWHSPDDQRFVALLRARLEGDGIESRPDELKSNGGDYVRRRIYDGLKESDFLAVVLSRSSVRSEWIESELGTAAGIHQYESRGASILPLLREECDVPPLLLNRRYANFKDDPDSAYLELVESVSLHYTQHHPDVDVSRICFPALHEDLLDYLARDAAMLAELPPRLFEEIVASILRREGFEVHLTTLTKDGGYDVLALKQILPGVRPTTTIVQCKRYNRPVGLDAVRALGGAALLENADRAMLVTTSTFTRSARDIAERLSIDLVDGHALSNWIAGTPGPASTADPAGDS